RHQQSAEAFEAAVAASKPWFCRRNARAIRAVGRTSHREQRSVSREPCCLHFARNRLPCGCEIRMRFGDGMDIVGAGFFKNALGCLLPMIVVGMNRKQNSSATDAAFKPFGFVLWDTESNQSPGDGTQG